MKKEKLVIYTALTPRPPREPEFRIGSRVQHGKDRGFIHTIFEAYDENTGVFNGFRYKIEIDKDRERRTLVATELSRETYLK